MAEPECIDAEKLYYVPECKLEAAHLDVTMRLLPAARVTWRQRQEDFEPTDDPNWARQAAASYARCAAALFETKEVTYLDTPCIAMGNLAIELVGGVARVRVTYHNSGSGYSRPLRATPEASYEYDTPAARLATVFAAASDAILREADRQRPAEGARPAESARPAEGAVAAGSADS